MTEEEQPVEDQPLEVDPATLIDGANKAAERLEAANKKMESLIQTQQKLVVEKTFGGESEAGVKRISKEEKAQEAAKKLLHGTGMEEYAFPNAKTDSSYN